MFFDASALAKLVVREAGSDRVRELHDPNAGVVLAATRLAPVEVAAALHRRARAGDLDTDTALRLARAVSDVVEARYEIQDVTAPVASDALRLLAHYRVSATDALHLAAAREMARARADLQIDFVCSDAALADAARAQGLDVEDPAALR